MRKQTLSGSHINHEFLNSESNTMINDCIDHWRGMRYAKWVFACRREVHKWPEGRQWKRNFVYGSKFSCLPLFMLFVVPCYTESAFGHMTCFGHQATSKLVMNRGLKSTWCLCFSPWFAIRICSDLLAGDRDMCNRDSKPSWEYP